MLGREIGPYWVLEQIDRRGTVSVFRGAHKKREESVLICELPGDAFSDADGRQRLLAMAKRLSRRAPRGVARVALCREEKDAVTLATEYPEQSLEELLEERGRLPWDQAVDFSLQVLGALKWLHLRGFSHGNISPRSIRMAKGGNVKLCELFTVCPSNESSPALDLAAVAVILDRMVTGNEKSAPAEPQPPHPAPPAPLTEVLQKALSSDPEERYQSAKEFSVALTNLRAHTVRGKRAVFARLLANRPLFWGLAVVLMVLPVAIALLWREHDRARVPSTTPVTPVAAPHKPKAEAAAVAPSGKAPAAQGALKEPEERDSQGAAPHRERKEKHKVSLNHKKRNKPGYRAHRGIGAVPAEAATILPTGASDLWSIRK